MNMMDNLFSSSENVAQLQRLYRITEGDRRVYSRDTKVTLLRQRKIIHKLESEREKLLSQMKVGEEKSLINRESDLNSMLDVYKLKRRQLHQERQFVQNQISEIQSLDKEIGKLIITKGNIQLSTINVDSINSPGKRIEILEDRLENASIHYNKLLYEGGRLRRDIESLLKQRNVRRRIIHRLGQESTSLKGEMERLADEAIINYNAREVAYQKLQALKGDHEIDDRLCKSQVQEAQRVLELQKTLVMFVATKNRRRMMPTILGRSRKSDRRKSIGGGGGRGTGDSNADTELFNYTSNLNNKVEELQNEIDSLTEEVQQLEASVFEQEEQQKLALNKLELQLGDLNDQCNNVEEEMKTQQTMLDELKSGIDVLSQIVGRRLSNVGQDDERMSKTAIGKAIKDIERSVDRLLRTKHILEVNDFDGKLTPSPSSINKRRSTRIDFQSIKVSHPSIDIVVTPPNLQLLDDVGLALQENGINCVDRLTDFINQNVTVVG